MSDPRLPDPAPAGDAGADAGAEVVDLPALVRLDPPVVVEVLANGEWWPGMVSAYRGRGVSVSWSKGPGMRHLTWEPADHVRRVYTALEQVFARGCHAGSVAGGL